MDGLTTLAPRAAPGDPRAALETAPGVARVLYPMLPSRPCRRDALADTGAIRRFELAGDGARGFELAGDGARGRMTAARHA